MKFDVRMDWPHINSIAQLGSDAEHMIFPPGGTRFAQPLAGDGAFSASRLVAGAGAGGKAVGALGSCTAVGGGGGGVVVGSCAAGRGAGGAALCSIAWYRPMPSTSAPATMSPMMGRLRLRLGPGSGPVVMGG